MFKYKTKRFLLFNRSHLISTIESIFLLMLPSSSFVLKNSSLLIGWTPNQSCGIKRLWYLWLALYIIRKSVFFGRYEWAGTMHISSIIIAINSGSVTSFKIVKQFQYYGFVHHSYLEKNSLEFSIVRPTKQLEMSFAPLSPFVSSYKYIWAV